MRPPGTTAPRPLEEPGESSGAEVAAALAAQHRATICETHGSWVVVGDDHAWKIKKPVRWSFLDYADREARRHACAEEVRVNAVLAPRIYLGVRPVLVRDGSITLGELGELASEQAIEYVVEMRRFDERATMASRLTASTLTHPDVVAAARRIAEFHAGAKRFVPEDPVGALRDRIDADLDDLDDAGFSERTADLRRTASGLLSRGGAQIERRAAAGLVRDGHGDLRADHVLLSYGLPIVDRLEFDARLRIADVADDLAFLAMDLEARGARWAADVLTAAYAEAGGPAAPAPLAAGFAWRRAVVRIKVARISRDGAGVAALLELAERLAWRTRGSGVVAVCGPPASGKSTLAAALGDRLELEVISSDRVRKELLGIDATRRAPPEGYAPGVTTRVYAELRNRVCSALRNGAAGVVVDATYRSAAERATLEQAVDGGVGWVWCDPPAEVLERRAARRAANPARVSDAGPEVAARLAAAFVPLAEQRTLRLGAEPTQAAMLAAVAAWLDGSAEAVPTR